MVWSGLKIVSRTALHCTTHTIPLEFQTYWGGDTPDLLFAIVPGITLNVRLDLGIAEYIVQYRPRSWVQEVSMQGIPLI